MALKRQSRGATPRAPRVGLLHYTCPPVIGGVETILYEQAVRLSKRGFPVTILSGRGGPLPDPKAARLVIIPELDSRDTAVSAVRDALDHGHVPSEFATLRADIGQRLSTELAELDVLIVHNALTLHFNLPLTAALWTLADTNRPRIIPGSMTSAGSIRSTGRGCMRASPGISSAASTPTSPRSLCRHRGSRNCGY